MTPDRFVITQDGRYFYGETEDGVHFSPSAGDASTYVTRSAAATVVAYLADECGCSPANFAIEELT